MAYNVLDNNAKQQPIGIQITTDTTQWYNLYHFTDTVCGRAVRRCRDAPACNEDLRRVMKRCQDSSLDCKRCGLAMSRMVENRHGLSVLLCTDHLHRERQRVENFLQQCTNTDRTTPPPPFQIAQRNI